MTKKQAIKLWKAAIQEEIIFIPESSPPVTKPSPFTTLLYFLDSYKDISIDLKNYNYSNIDCKEVAKFLKEWADALESKEI